MVTYSWLVFYSIENYSAAREHRSKIIKLNFIRDYFPFGISCMAEKKSTAPQGCLSDFLTKDEEEKYIWDKIVKNLDGITLP